MPADQQHIPLEVEFLQGSLIGVANPRLPIRLTFSSAKPCSFSTMLEFVDDSGFSYSIRVSGGADACLFTLAPFLTVRLLTATFVLRPTPATPPTGCAGKCRIPIEALSLSFAKEAQGHAAMSDVIDVSCKWGAGVTAYAFTKIYVTAYAFTKIHLAQMFCMHIQASTTSPGPHHTCLGPV